MLSDDERDGKCWELEHMVGHENKRGKIWYLVHWKGYRSKEDSWKKLVELKYTKRFMEEYYVRLRRRKKLTEKTDRKRTRL